MSRALISWFAIGGFAWCALGAGVMVGCNTNDSVAPASVSVTPQVVEAPSVDVKPGLAVALPSTQSVVSAAVPPTASPAISGTVRAAREPKPLAVLSAVAPPRALPSVSPAPAVSIAPVAATVAPAPLGAPCKATAFKFPSVADACKKGGVKQAKAMMKTLVNRAKANGQVVKCTSCHSDSKTYALKSNANADFKALLALPPG